MNLLPLRKNVRHTGTLMTEINGKKIRSHLEFSPDDRQLKMNTLNAAMDATDCESAQFEFLYLFCKFC